VGAEKEGLFTKARTMLCLCAVLFLYGCGAAQPRAISFTQVQAALAEPISADICIQTQETTVKGRLERTGPEVYSFVASAPQSLEGLSLQFQQQELKLGYRGMELELGTEIFPEGFVLSSLNQMLDELLRQQAFSFVNTEDGGGKLSGEVSGKAFELVIDPQCKPLKFSLPEEKITILWLEKSA